MNSEEIRISDEEEFAEMVREMDPKERERWERDVANVLEANEDEIEA